MRSLQRSHFVDKRNSVTYLLKFTIIVKNDNRSKTQLFGWHCAFPTVLGWNQVFHLPAQGHVHCPALTLYSRGGFSRILWLMHGKLTMFFFPLVSTKGSEVMLVFIFYRRRKWKSYGSFRQENVSGSHFSLHLPHSKDGPEPNPGLNFFLKFLEKKAEWSSRWPLGLDPCSAY